MLFFGHRSILLQSTTSTANSGLYDVILPMFVLRRLDCLLEPTKEAALEEVRFQREDAEMADLEKRAADLRDQLREHNYRYFVLGSPTVADAEYDALLTVADKTK